MSPPSPSAWFDRVDPIVRAIVRKKLRVTLSEYDYRRENQDALDVVQGILGELARAFGVPDAEVGDQTGYAVVVAYHACSQHLRARYPARARLKNKVRYFLTHAAGFAIWPGRDGEVYAGYAGWTARPPGRQETINALMADPAAVWREASARASGPVKTLERMKPADWLSLVEGVLNATDGPVELDDLVGILGALFRVKDELAEPLNEPAVTPRPDDEMYQREMLVRLWQIVREFEHRWLMAFLLNLPGHTREARGEIEAFEDSGAATREEIGRVLGLTGQEYQAIGRHAHHWPGDPGSPEKRLLAMWPHLPLEDVVIGEALGCRKQQVINLRAVAVQKAAKRLREALAWKKP